MGMLEGKAALVTGAGRGIGRGIAMALARAGARVVVNDLGASLSGEGGEVSPAQKVVEEIVKAGGVAAPNFGSVTDFGQATGMVEQVIDTFGRIDVLVNVAGNLRDRMLFNMSEAEWDAVITVHLKGHAAPTRHACGYWREKSKAGDAVNASIVCTSSTSGLLGNAGQSNYGAAKAGIAAFAQIVSMEMARHGVRCNAIAPAARTRMTEATFGEIKSAGPFDEWAPENIAPLVAFLATDEAKG